MGPETGPCHSALEIPSQKTQADKPWWKEALWFYFTVLLHKPVIHRHHIWSNMPPPTEACLLIWYSSSSVWMYHQWATHLFRSMTLMRFHFRFPALFRVLHLIYHSARFHRAICPWAISCSITGYCCPSISQRCHFISHYLIIYIQQWILTTRFVLDTQGQSLSLYPCPFLEKKMRDLKGCL